MSVHIFWPPLAILAMFVIVVAVLILKYGDKLCKARTVPLPQTFELEDRSSENTNFTYNEERAMMDEPDDFQLEIMPMDEKPEKYEERESYGIVGVEHAV